MSKPPAPRPSILGTPLGYDGRGGGMLPSLRTTYPPSVRRALHALAESNPTPERYRTERERILGDA
jgi:hypothetical protein